MKNSAEKTFATSLAIILICSFFIEQPHITSLALVVILSAHSALSLFLTEHFLQNNFWVVLLGASAINSVIFSLVAFPFWMFLRKEQQFWGCVVILAFLVVYLALLFLLFPATDGP